MKDVGDGHLAQGDNVTISGMPHAQLNGDFVITEVVSRTVFKFDFMQNETNPATAAASFGALTVTQDANGNACSSSPSGCMLKHNGQDATAPTITGVSSTSECEVYTPTFSITQIALDHASNTATATIADTGYRELRVGDAITITGGTGDLAWANTAWTITGVPASQHTVFEFSVVENSRTNPSSVDVTFIGIATVHMHGAYTDGSFVLELPRAHEVVFDFTKIDFDGSVATVTHASTEVARLRAGDAVTLAGFTAAVDGTHTVKVGTNPTDTSFQFDSAISAGTEISNSAQTVQANLNPRSGVIATASTAAEFKAALEGATNALGFGSVTVTRQQFGTYESSWSGGFLWYIQFNSLGGDIEKLDVRVKDDLTTDTNAVEVGTGSSRLPVNPKTHARLLTASEATIFPIEANVISGVFQLSFDGAVTSNLSATATALDVETALNDASVMGAGAVSVQRFHPSGAGSGTGPGPAGGYQWAVTFIGDNVGGNVDMLITASVQHLEATNPNIAITEATPGNQLQGTFFVRAWDGSADVTGHLDYYISAANMEMQLESLNSIGDVTVTRSTLGTKGPQVRSYQWTITFESNIHSGTDSALTWASPPAGAAGISRSWGPNVGDIPNMACLIPALTTSHQPSISSVKCSVAEVTKGTEPLTNSFKLTFDTTGLGSVFSGGNHTSGFIHHAAVASTEDSNADGTSMEEILEAMPNIGDVSVTRSAVTTTTGGYTWTITFLRDAYDSVQCNYDGTGCPSPGNVPELDANALVANTAQMLPANTTTITTAETTRGNTLRGAFTLQVNGAGAASDAIGWDESASDVDTKLEALAGIGNVDVTRVRTSKYGTHYWIVTFTRNWDHLPTGAGDVDPLTADTSLITESGVGCGAACIATSKAVSIVETQKGSTGLGNEFTLQLDDSVTGPVVVKVDDTPHAVRTKIEQLTSVNKVWVTRYEYPSSSTGGWGAVAQTDGTLGGYAWKITFLDNIGQYNGKTFPPSSGDVPMLVSADHTLTGTGAMISVYEVLPGSNPFAGTFALSVGSVATPPLDYDISTAELKSNLEALPTVGHVSVTSDVLTGAQLPGTVSVRRGATVLLPTADLRGHLAPGDVVRIGPLDASGTPKDGVSGEFPIAGTALVSRGKATVYTSENLRSTLFDGQQVRIAGTAYTVAHNGAEIQRVVVASKMPISSGGYRLVVGSSLSSACLSWDAEASYWESSIKSTGSIGTVSVARYGDGTATSDVDSSPISVTISEIVVAGSTAVATHTALDTTAKGTVQVNDMVTIAGMSTAAFNTFWTVTARTDTTFTFAIDESVNRVARVTPGDNTYTETGTATVSAPHGYRYEIAFTDTAHTHTQVRTASGPMSFEFANLTIDAVGLATITHASTVFARLFEGDKVILAGFATAALNGEQTVKLGTTPTDTSFQFETSLGSADGESATGQTVVALPCSSPGHAAWTFDDGLSTLALKTLAITSNVATITHATTVSPRLVAGDRLVISGITSEPALNDLAYVTVKAGTTPTATSFQFDTSGLSDTAQIEDEVGSVATRVSTGDATVQARLQRVARGHFMVESVIVTGSGTLATVQHALTQTPLISKGDTVEFALTGFAWLDGKSWTVTGAPTQAYFTLNPSELGRVAPADNTYVSSAAGEGLCTVTATGATSTALQMTTSSYPYPVVLDRNFEGASAVGSLMHSIPDLYVVQEDGRGVQTMAVRSSGVITQGTLTLSTSAWADPISLDLTSINKIGSLCTVTMNADTDAVLEAGVKVDISNFANTDFNKVWTLTACSACASTEFTFDFTEHGGGTSDGTYALYLGVGTSATGSLKYTTDTFSWNVDERALERELETLYLLDDVSVVRTGDASASGTAGAAYGYVYSIYFDGARARALQAKLSASNRLLVEAESSFDPLLSGGTGNVLVSEIVAPRNVDTLTSTAIPLAKRSAPDMKAHFLAAHVEVASPLQIYRVSGQRWHVSMDSLIGDREAMAIVGTPSLASGTTLAVVDDFHRGIGPGSYNIPSLVKGVEYHVRASTTNAQGYGATSVSAALRPMASPSAPRHVAAEHTPHQDEIQTVQVTASHEDEVQTVTTSATPVAETQAFVTSADVGALINNGSLAVTLFGASTAHAKQTVSIMANTDGDVIKVGGFQLGYPMDLVLSVTEISVLTNVATVTHASTTTVRLKAGDRVRLSGATNSAFNTVVVVTGVPTVTTFDFATTEADFVYTGEAATGAPTAYTQTCIPFDAPETAMEAYLQSEIDDITDVTVARSGTGATVQGLHSSAGYTWTIAFVDTTTAGATEPDLIVDLACKGWGTAQTTGVSGIAATVATTDVGGFDLDFNATAAQVKSEIEKIPHVGEVDGVTRTLVDDQGGYFWTVEFATALGDIPLMTCAVDNMAGFAGAACTPKEIRDGNILSGHFILGLGGEMTTNIDALASAADVDAALENLLGVDTVEVTRSSPDGQKGYTWTITFTSNVGDIPLMSASNSLVGTGAAIAVAETNKGINVDGAFYVTYGGATSAAIYMNTSAMEFESHLESMSTIGAVMVTKSSVDTENGYTWTVRFNDPTVHPGDLALLGVDTHALTGAGVAARVREIQKGSETLSNTASVFFSAPSDNGGSAISKYKVEVDTSTSFASGNLRSFEISNPAALYDVQHVSTSALCNDEVQLVRAFDKKKTTTLTWSGTSADGVVTGSFRLSHNGIASACIDYWDSSVAGTAAAMQAKLNALDGVGLVTVAETGASSNDIVFTITHEATAVRAYDWEYEAAAGAGGCIQAATSDGTTRTPVPILADTGQLSGTFALQFECPTCLVTTQQTTGTIDPSAATGATSLQDRLNALSSVGNGIVATRTNSSIGEGYEWLVTFKGGYVHGDVPLLTVSTNSLTGDHPAGDADAPTVVVTEYLSGEAVTGTFLLQYDGSTTNSILASATSLQMRTALETLSTIDTVSVSRDYSWQALPGTVSVTHGSHLVTTTADLSLSHLSPGDLVMIDGTTFRVSTASATLSSSGFSLIDAVSGSSADFMGVSGTGIQAYSWSNGFKWAVTFQKTLGSSPDVSLPLTIGMHSLGPANSAEIRVLGGVDRTVLGATRARDVGCDGCARISALTEGNTYHVRMTAYNAMGFGPASATVTVVPRKIPTAPTSVQLTVVSGSELEVAFSPPTSTGGDTITKYVVDWDTNAAFNANGVWAPLGSTTVSGGAIAGTPPYTYVIGSGTPLTMGTPYFVRVRAENSVAYQQINVEDVMTWNYAYESSSPLSAAPADKVPTAPVAVVVTLVGASTLRVQITPPARSGGPSVTSYTVQWDVTSTFPESSPLAGSAVAATSSMTELGAGGALVYDITGLVAGQAYYTRVFASNSVGAGPATLSAPQFMVPMSAPSVPASMSVTTPTVQATPITTATVTWTAPTSNQGSAITGYMVEWYGLDQIKEVQTIETAVTASGSYNLAFDGVSFGQVAHDISAVQLRRMMMTTSRLEISAIAHIVVASSGVATVTYTAPSSIRAGDQVTIIAMGSGGEFANGQWTVLPGADLSSTFTFSTTEHGASAPAAQTYDGAGASAKVLVCGDVTISRVPRTNGYLWSITFNDVQRNNGDVPRLLVDGASLLSGTGAPSQVHVTEIQKGRRADGGNAEVQTLTLTSSAAVSGFFRLSFGGSGYTNYVPMDAPAAAVEEALEALSTVRQVSVSVEGDGSANACSTSVNGPCPYGYRWHVTFTEHTGDQPVMSVDKTKLHAVGNALVTMSVLDGDNEAVTTPTAGRVCLACAPGETPSEYGHQIVSAYTYAYTVTGLVPGRAYKFRVSATNAQGYGPYTGTETRTPPLQLPQAPASVATSTHPTLSSSLQVTIGAPSSDGGDEILKYKVEYSTAASFAGAGSLEVRCPTYPIRKVVRVQTKGNGNTINGSHFKLAFTKAGVTVNTPKIWYDTVPMASEELGAVARVYTPALGVDPQNLGSMQSILQDLSNMVPARGNALQAVQVTREGPDAEQGYIWLVTFLGDGDDYSLSLASSALTDAAGAGTATVTVTETITGHTYTNCKTDIEIPGLVQGTPYYVRAYAYNSLGYSLATHAAGGSLKPLKVPGAPTAVTLSVVSGTSLRLVWSPPTDDGGDTVTSYKVEWDTLSNFSSTNAASHDVLYLSGGAPFIYTITGLSMGQLYYVRVKAANVAGYGSTTSSTPNSEHPRQLPTAPTGVEVGVTSNSKLTVTFAPPYSDGGDPVTKYKIEWDRSSSFGSLLSLPHRGEVEVFATQNMSYTINSLTSGTVYYVRLSAANNVGYGAVQMSSPAFAIMYNQVPGKPTAATTVAYNSTTMRVDWSAPFIPAHGIACGGRGSDHPDPNVCPSGMGSGTEADGGVAIHQYVVEWDTQANFGSTNALPLKGSAVIGDMTSKPFAYYITNLPCYDYYVRIYAHNTIGTGQACNKDGSLCDGARLAVTQTQLGC
jgi:hypothetical protein